MHLLELRVKLSVVSSVVSLAKGAPVGHTVAVCGTTRHGGHREVCDKGDGGQGLAAEPQRGDALQVAKVAQLGCRVALAQQRQILFLRVWSKALPRAGIHVQLCWCGRPVYACAPGCHGRCPVFAAACCPPP